MNTGDRRHAESTSKSAGTTEMRNQSQHQNTTEVGSVGRARAEGSRANALKHGLTSKTLLPQALQSAGVEA